MYKIQSGNAYNVPVPTFYVESEAEIADIPENVPAGTLVEVNDPAEFKVFMKMENQTWNEL